MRQGVPAAAVGSGSGAAGGVKAVDSGGELVVGALVEHDKFGRGRVAALETMAGDQKITVEFEAAGRRTLLRKFAKLRVIG